jgi:hypothetical protein
MYGLSLEQAPPYRLPLLYYRVAGVHLVIVSVLLMIYGMDIENRYYYEAIALTHLVTLGFFTHVMFGSLFQMIPVIMGLAYPHVVRNGIIIIGALNGGIVFFLAGLLSAHRLWMQIGTLFLVGGMIYFAWLSLKTLWGVEDKNPMVKTFMVSFICLIVGVMLGMIVVFEHLDGFNAMHIVTVIYGWVFMLICGVAYKVIPMFYVTKEYPQFIQKYYWVFTLLLIVLYMLFNVAQPAISLLLGVGSGVFGAISIKLLKERKRPRRDTTITLWYFAMINLTAASLIWIASVVLGLEVDLLLGIVWGMGFIYALINGMLYKIIPFLTWFHLSSQGNFEAEMGGVIDSKRMKRQVGVFIAAYSVMLFALIIKPLVFFAGLLLLLSSLLLVDNIRHGYSYYKKMEVRR